MFTRKYFKRFVAQFSGFVSDRKADIKSNDSHDFILPKKERQQRLSLEVPPDGETWLNLGCGDKILPGYINVDFAESRKGQTPDVIADLRQLDFEANYADRILSVHVIEHFYSWEAEEMLSEWMRILKPGGTIILECPNILYSAMQLASSPELAAETGKEAATTMWSIYGDPGWRDPLMCHKWGYTPQSLTAVLERIGFEDVIRESALYKKGDPRDMRVTGRKRVKAPHE